MPEEKKENEHSQEQEPSRISGRISFKNWDKEKPKIVAEIRRSERLTGEDLATRINARG